MQKSHQPFFYARSTIESLNKIENANYREYLDGNNGHLEVDHVDLPTALEWSNLVIELFEEKVEEIDKNENYDPKKSPNFHDWLVNG